MKKIILFLIIFFLILLTTITKNSAKKLENMIYNVRENITTLEKRYEMSLLDYNYLSAPERLFTYQKKFFENELKTMNILEIRTLEINDGKIKIDELIIKDE